MLSRLLKVDVCALFVLLAWAGPADAFGRRHTACQPAPVCSSPCWYPCDPCCPGHWCWPPNETPLIPPPAHPTPHTTLASKLTLQNKSYSEAFAIIYIRHPDGVYREYEKHRVPAGANVVATQPYYAADHLLIETWTRGTPTDCWHCRCGHLITLSGASGHFDIVHCAYTHP